MFARHNFSSGHRQSTVFPMWFSCDIITGAVGQRLSNQLFIATCIGSSWFQFWQRFYDFYRGQIHGDDFCPMMWTMNCPSAMQFLASGDE
jgi:hypothetical protein